MPQRDAASATRMARGDARPLPWGTSMTTRDARRALLGAGSFAVVTVLALPASGQAAAVSFTPRGDGTADAARPHRTDTRARPLLVSRSPRRAAYLRFVVTGLGAQPPAAGAARGRRAVRSRPDAAAVFGAAERCRGGGARAGRGRDPSRERDGEPHRADRGAAQGLPGRVERPLRRPRHRGLHRVHR